MRTVGWIWVLGLGGSATACATRGSDDDAGAPTSAVDESSALDESSGTDGSSTAQGDDGSSTGSVDGSETTATTVASMDTLECEEGPEACDVDEPCGDAVCGDDEVCVVPGDACVCDDEGTRCDWVAVEPSCIAFPDACVGVGLVEPCLVEALCPSEDDFGGGGSFDEGVLQCLPAVAECQGDCDVIECGGSSSSG